MLLQFGTGFDVQTNRRIHMLAHLLRRHEFNWLTNVTPAYDSLLLEYKPWLVTRQIGQTCFGVISHKVRKLLNECTGEETAGEGRLVEIPVCYDISLGNDLLLVSELTGLSAETIVGLHAGARYHVFMMGFLPGFAYMGPLSQEIVLPRKARTQPVKQGAVAIAGNQTGIYPSASPGGWYVLGYTRYPLFRPTDTPPVVLQPGMQVQFVPVSLKQYNEAAW